MPQQDSPSTSQGTLTQSPVQAQASNTRLDWDSAVDAIANRQGVDPVLVRRIIGVESGGNPGAVSPKGAVGLMQLMPETAKRYGVDPKDPIQNIGAGVAEMSRLLKKYNNHYGRAVAAYNAGEGAVDNADNVIPQIPETQDYVLRVLGGYKPPNRQRTLSDVVAAEKAELARTAPTSVEKIAPGAFSAGRQATGIGPAQPTGVLDKLRSWIQQPPTTPLPLLPGESRGAIDPTRASGSLEQEASPITTGVGKFVAGSTTPENLAIMAAMPPISAVNAGAVARAAGGGFAASMLGGGIQQTVAAKTDWDAGNTQRAKEEATQAALSVLTAGWAGHRSLYGAAGPPVQSQTGVMENLVQQPRTPTQGAVSEVPGARTPLTTPPAPTPALPTPPGPRVTVRTIEPLGNVPAAEPTLRPEVAAMAQAPREVTPEMKQELIDRYKTILRHPEATAEDRVHAGQRLQELGALVSTVERPAPAGRTIEEIVKTVSAENRPKDLPRNDLQQLAELTPTTAKAAGLSRDDHMAARAAWKRITDPEVLTPVTPTSTVNQSITRLIRSKSNEELSSRGNELLDAVKGISKETPAVKEKAAASLDVRAGQAQQLIESLQRIRNANDFSKSVSEELHENLAGKLFSGENVGIDPKTNRAIVETQLDEQGQPVKGGPPFVSAISHEARQYLNIVRGNMVGSGAGTSPRYRLSRDEQTGEANLPSKLSSEEKQARVELANKIQDELNSHFQEVYAQGGVPTAEQRSKGTELISLLQSTTGKRLLYTGKMNPQGGFDPGTIAPNRSWMNWAMRRPQSSHFAKPSDTQIQARIEELQHEVGVSQTVAKTLRGTLPKDHAAHPEAPKPVQSVASAPPAPVQSSPEDIAQRHGLQYRGEVSPGTGVHDFKAPDGGSLNLRSSELNDETVASKIAQRSAQITNLSPELTKKSAGFEPGKDLRPVPQTEAVKVSTDSMGVRWAQSPEGHRVSIPKRISDAEIEEYAKPKLAEQAEIHGAIKARTAPTQTVKVKRYDPTGKFISEGVEAVPAPKAEEVNVAAKREDLSSMRRHLANLELKGLGGSRAAEKLRKGINAYERVVGPSEVTQGYVTNVASDVIRAGEKAAKAAQPRTFIEPLDNSHEGKGDDLVALLGTATGEGVPRALHSAILKLHDLTPEEDRDYLAHAAMVAGFPKGIDEVARRYAGSLSVLREGLKGGLGPQALQDANYFAQHGKRPIKGSPGEAGFVNVPSFVPAILNELGKYASNAKTTATDIYKWAGRWLAQGTYAGVSETSRNAMFKFRGDLNRIEDLGRVAFNDAIVAVRSLPTLQQDALMAQAQRGAPMPTADLQGVRDIIQQIQDANYVKLHALRPNLNYWRDHIGTIWEKAPNNAAALYEKHAQVVNHAMLQGDRGMLRQRIYQTVLEGIAAGGVPATHNFIEMALLDLGRQAQYIHANTELLPAIKAQGRMARGDHEASQLKQWGFMPNPVRVPENIVSTWFPVETATGGTVIAKGTPYYMEAGELKMLQKWLAPDFVRNKLIGKAILNFKNIYTPIELFGMFHFSSIMAKEVAVNMAQGLNRSFNSGVLRNDVGEATAGLKDFMSSLAAPYTAYKNGRILREAAGQTLVAWQKYNFDKHNWLNSSNGQRLSKIIPNLEETIDALLEGGARLDTKPEYATRWRQAMVQSWVDRNYIKSGSMVPFAALEKFTSLLFEKYIPAVKLFAASKEINVELSRQANAIQSGETSREAVIQAAVRRIDNVLGELNWENLNASKGMRTWGMLLWRAPGWRMGTVDLLKNAGMGQAKDVFNAFKNQRVPTIDPNLMYMLAEMGLLAGISTVIMSLMAHKAPSSMTDLTNPQTGQLDSRGKPLRLDVALYSSRDFREILTNPFGYATGGQSGYVSKSIEAFKNRTYQGSLVTEREGISGTAERALHAITPVPFGYTGYQRLKSQGFPSGEGIALNLFGLNPSRRDLDMTDAEKVLSDSERRFQITRDAKETAKLQAKQAIQGAYLNQRFDDLARLQMQALESGTLKWDEMKKATDDARKPYLERMASGSAVRPKDLLKAYMAGTPYEQKVLMPYLWKALKKDPSLEPEFMDFLKREPTHPPSGATVKPIDYRPAQNKPTGDADNKSRIVIEGIDEPVKRNGDKMIIPTDQQNTYVRDPLLRA